jgi:hypothetical protein
LYDPLFCPENSGKPFEKIYFFLILQNNSRSVTRGSRKVSEKKLAKKAFNTYNWNNL